MSPWIYLWRWWVWWFGTRATKSSSPATATWHCEIFWTTVAPSWCWIILMIMPSCWPRKTSPAVWWARPWRVPSARTSTPAEWACSTVLTRQWWPQQWPTRWGTTLAWSTIHRIVIVGMRSVWWLPRVPRLFQLTGAAAALISSQ